MAFQTSLIVGELARLNQNVVTMNANLLLVLQEQRHTNELLAAVAAPKKVVASWHIGQDVVVVRGTLKGHYGRIADLTGNADTVTLVRVQTNDGRLIAVDPRDIRPVRS